MKIPRTKSIQLNIDNSTNSESFGFVVDFPSDDKYLTKSINIFPTVPLPGKLSWQNSCLQPHCMLETCYTFASEACIIGSVSGGLECRVGAGIGGGGVTARSSQVPLDQLLKMVNRPW